MSNFTPTSCQLWTLFFNREVFYRAVKSNTEKNQFLEGKKMKLGILMVVIGLAAILELWLLAGCGAVGAWPT